MRAETADLYLDKGRLVECMGCELAMHYFFENVVDIFYVLFHIFVETNFVDIEEVCGFMTFVRNK